MTAAKKTKISTSPAETPETIFRRRVTAYNASIDTALNVFDAAVIKFWQATGIEGGVDSVDLIMFRGRMVAAKAEERDLRTEQERNPSWTSANIKSAIEYSALTRFGNLWALGKINPRLDPTRSIKTLPDPVETAQHSHDPSIGWAERN